MGRGGGGPATRRRGTIYGHPPPHDRPYPSKHRSHRRVRAFSGVSSLSPPNVSVEPPEDQSFTENAGRVLCFFLDFWFFGFKTKKPKKQNKKQNTKKNETFPANFGFLVLAASLCQSRPLLLPINCLESPPKQPPPRQPPVSARGVGSNLTAQPKHPTRRISVSNLCPNSRANNPDSQSYNYTNPTTKNQSLRLLKMNIHICVHINMNLKSYTTNTIIELRLHTNTPTNTHKTVYSY